MTAIRQPGAQPRDSGGLPTASGSRRAAARGRRQRRLAVLSTLAFGVVLIGGTGLRLWHLGISPAWQWDEAVYYRVSINVQHGLLSEHTLYGNYEPFLYQPPFYFLFLSRWFTLVGVSIWHARLLGVLLTAVMQTLLFRLLWKLHGSTTALFAIIPVVFDGWLMYIERVSYMENALMVLIVLGFLLYQSALEKPSGYASRSLEQSLASPGASSRQAFTFCWLSCSAGSSPGGPTRGISCWPPSRWPSWPPISW